MKIIDLGGNWLVRQTENDEQISANVPGDIYADLLREGKIPDPFYRNNEEQLQWIGEKNWIYTREFSVADSLLENDKILLCCDGLDTFATITLNGKILAQTDNMFRSYEWDVKSILIQGTNSLEISFTSTIPYAQKKQKERYLPCWGIDSEGYDENWVMHKPHKVNISHGWIRKEQCN
jgi:beta-mannosidase